MKSGGGMAVEAFIANLMAMMPLHGCLMSDPERTCIREIEEQIKDAVHFLGFQCYRYSIHQKGINSPDTYSIAVSNFPKKWEEIYEAAAYYKVDPIVKIFMSHESARQALDFGTWKSAFDYGVNNPEGKSEAEKKFNQNRIEALYEKARDFNLKSGIFLVHGDDKCQTLMSMSSSEEPEVLEQRIDENFWRAVHMFVVLVEYSVGLTSGCDACMQGIRFDGGKPVGLSEKQRRLLIAFHKNPNATINEIAKLSDTAASTVNFHLKAIRKKLNRPGFSGAALAQFAKDHNMF
ncbi:MAG: autoinducer binding domain-containing protein [Pseudomonadales bacterium]|nr:autoinducer binding domain-containing protein [Pseudomonadales bacterium]